VNVFLLELHLISHIKVLYYNKRYKYIKKSLKKVILTNKNVQNQWQKLVQV